MAKKFPEAEEKGHFENTRTESYKASPKFNVIHRDNCPIEITVAGEMIRFDAHGVNPVSPEKYQNGMPKEILEHPDFQTAKKYFTIVAQ